MSEVYLSGPSSKVRAIVPGTVQSFITAAIVEY